MGTEPGIARPNITRIITATICFMLLLFSLPSALSATGVGAHSAANTQQNQPLLPVDTATTAPTDTPTATATNTPSPTPTATNTPSPTPTRVKPTPTKEPTTAPTVRPTATAAHPTATGAANKANATATTAAALTPAATQDTGGGQVLPPANTPAPRNNSGPNPTPGTSQSGIFAFLPLLAGGTAILAIIVILGFLLLRKYVSPTPVSEAKLPPSGARPWSRTRNPESLHGIADDNDLKPAPAMDNAWQNPAFSNIFAASQSGSLPGNASGSLPDPNAGFAFPQSASLPTYPGFPAAAGLAAANAAFTDNNMTAQMNFPDPGSNFALPQQNFLAGGSIANPPTQFGFSAPATGFASPQHSFDPPNGSFASTNSGLLPSQKGFSPASSGLTPAQENFASPQSNGFAPPSGNPFAQNGPASPPQSLASGRGNPLLASGSLSPVTEDFMPPSGGFGLLNSGPTPAQPKPGQGKPSKEVPDWLLAMENDVRNDPFLAETLKQYTDKGRAARVEKDDGKPK